MTVWATESKKLDFGIGEKWDQFSLWQQSADNLAEDDYGIPFLAHWMWLKNHFGPDDIFARPLPDVIPSAELIPNCKQDLFIDHFLNPNSCQRGSCLKEI